MLDRQVRNARWWREHLHGPRPHGVGDEEIAARVAWSEREHDHTTAHRAEFAAALRPGLHGR